MGNIRSFAYWTLDWLKGSPVRKNVKLIQKKKQTEYENQEELISILEYARKNVPYYANIQSSELNAFPVINKEKMKKTYEDFRSVEYLDDTKLLVHYTSGSSGTPFKAYQTKEKDDFHKAALIANNLEHGWEIGARWVHMRNWGMGAPATKLGCLKNNMVPLSILDLNDEKLEHIVQTLVKDKKLNII
jgi:phenylacetate-CoA ligase